MKRVLKLILVLAVVAAMAVSAFAAPSPITVTEDPEVYGVDEVVAVLDPGVTMKTGEASNSDIEANEAAAEASAANMGATVLGTVGSVQIDLFNNGQQVHAAVRTGTETVGQDIEQAAGALFKDRVYEQYAVRLGQDLPEILELIPAAADVAFSGDQTSGAGHTAGTVFDIPVKRMDKLDLCAHFLCCTQGNTAHGVVIAVLCAK